MLVARTPYQVKLYIYPDDHPPPHVHAVKGDIEMLIEIQSREVIGTARLRGAALHDVMMYVETHQAELLTTWNRLNPPYQR